MSRPKPPQAYTMDDGGVFVRGTDDLDIAIPVAAHFVVTHAGGGWWNNGERELGERIDMACIDLAESNPWIGRFRFNPCSPASCWGEGGHRFHLDHLREGAPAGPGRFLGVYWPEVR